MTTVIVPKGYDRFPLRPNAGIGNGQPVSSLNRARTVANQIRAYRGKELFSSPGFVGSFANAALSRDRWRFRFRTGPFTTAVRVVMTMARQNNGTLEGGGWAPSDPRGILTLFDASDVQVAQVVHHYGATSEEPANTPDQFGHGRYTISGLSPDTEYHGLFSEAFFGVLVSALVYELGPAHDTAHGYLPPLTAGGPIFDADRQGLVDFTNNMWRAGGAHLLNWTADDQASGETISSGTFTNVIDGASTTQSASTPGYTLDMTGKALSRQTTGVPITMWVYARRVSGSNAGSVRLRSSSGVNIATVTNIASATAQWSSDTGVIPAGVDKYDLQFAHSGGTGTTEVYAVSIYEHMT